MAIPAQYQEISVEGLPALSERMQTEGHRFVQVLAVNTEAGIDVQYTFMKDGVLEVFTIKGVTPEIPIPSITDRFIAAFVFENEIHDLFGVNAELLIDHAWGWEPCTIEAIKKLPPSLKSISSGQVLQSPYPAWYRAPSPKRGRSAARH